MLNSFFSGNRAVYETMWQNIVGSDRTQMTVRCMRIAYWIHRATNTQSENVILIVFHGNNGYANALQCYVIHILPVLS